MTTLTAYEIKEGTGAVFVNTVTKVDISQYELTPHVIRKALK